MFCLCINTSKVKPCWYDSHVGNRDPIADNEWYHCFNRGVDKRAVFMDENDCERLLALLYLCNDEDSITRISNFELAHANLAALLARKTIVRGAPLVEIGAYALMKNHLHFIIKQLTGGGVALFMQKVFTGYTMYFNTKYERTGALFAGSYKSKHIGKDEYFKQAIQYVLLNPAELFESGWKKGIGNRTLLEKELRRYKYSSLPDFIGVSRPESCIVGDIRSTYFDSVPSLSRMLEEAQEYYKENAKFLSATTAGTSKV